MIKIACAGLPVGRAAYQNQFPALELKPLTATTRPATVIKWRSEAPSSFEFVVASSALLTVSQRAHLSRLSPRKKNKGTPLSASLAAAETLSSRILFFPISATLPFTPDAIRRLQSFFPLVPRQGRQIVWSPPSFWPSTLVGDLSKSLGLTPALDPLKPTHRDVPMAFRYYRVGRRKPLGPVSALELQAIRTACDKPLSYVVFDTGPSAFQDAVRFKALI